MERNRYVIAYLYRTTWEVIINQLNIIILLYIHHHTMKYLAAYALLALAGKNNISTHHNTQPPKISKQSSPASNPTPTTTNSTELSRLWRENRSISWSLRVPRESELVDQLLLLEAKPKKKRSRPPKNNNPRRRKSPKSSRLMRIWATSSVDLIPLFKPYTTYSVYHQIHHHV